MNFQIIFVISLLTVSVYGAEWNYGNVSEWGGVCQTGTAQSPIDLIEDDAQEKLFSAFNFTHYEIDNNAKVKNNGHTVTITIEATDIPIMSGAGLIGEYRFDHFHFHWQSEHTVSGLRYPLEMHLVHYSTRFNSLNEAAAEPNGVAVLGVLFDLSIDDDQDFIPLLEVMDKVIRFPDNETDLVRRIAVKNFLPRNIGDYYRYTGSLTTPDCNEGVIWTVFHQTLPLSADQLEVFESVWAADGLLTLNYRPVQPMNGRVLTVRSSRRTQKGASASIASSAILTIITSLLVFIKHKLV